MGGGLMFEPLVKAWKAGDAAVRAKACLELRNLSGEPLGQNRAGQETNLVAFGNGALHYIRRGDFGERGGKPPGAWKGACDPSEVDAIWRALEGLTEKDFQGRAADPGEGVTQLQAHCGGRVVVLSWGPPEMGMDRPGVDALAPLRRLTANAQAETLWTLSLEQDGVVRKPEGAAFGLRFSNQGSQPMNFLMAPPGLGVDIAFKFAVDGSDENGPPLQIDWAPAKVELPAEPGLRIVSLAPGAALRVEAVITENLAAGTRFLGQFTYTQLGLGERVAGRNVFAGVSFTDVFPFQVPA